MSFAERTQTRSADKAQALGEIAAVLAVIDAEGREPTTWERLCLLRAFSLVSAGCYLIAAAEVRAATSDPHRALDSLAAEFVIESCTLPTLFEALKEAMAESPRLFPHLGPMALG